MAIAQENWDLAKALFMAGKSLNQIAKETGINRSTVGKKAQKENWNKETISTLVEKQIDTTIQQDELNRQKSTLNSTERDIYEKELLTESQARNLAMNTGQSLMKLLLSSANSGKKQVLVKDGLGMGATRHTLQMKDLEPKDIKDLTGAFRDLVGDTHIPKETSEEDDATGDNTPNEIVYVTMSAEQVETIRAERESKKEEYDENNK